MDSDGANRLITATEVTEGHSRVEHMEKRDLWDRETRRLLKSSMNGQTIVKILTFVKVR